MFAFLKKPETKIDFLIDMQNRRERMTWKYLKIVERMQKGTAGSEDIQILAAHFMVDDKDEYLSEEKAIKILDDLPQDEIIEVLGKFTEAISNSAVPKASGSNSRLPSEVGLAAEKLPNG